MGGLLSSSDTSILVVVGGVESMWILFIFSRKGNIVVYSIISVLSGRQCGENLLGHSPYQDLHSFIW